MTKILAIGCGGFLGAVARYSLSTWLHRATGTSFPIGTLAVNAIGCLLIGAIMHLLEQEAALSTYLRLFMVVGFVGGFTTFSALAFETWELLTAAEYSWAVLSMFGNLVIGMGALILGRLGADLLTR